MDNTAEVEILDENDITTQLPVITFNSTKLREQVHAFVEQYRNIVITEDNYKLAKHDSVTLNGVIKKLEARRKEIKHQLEAPVKAFDAEVKDIESEIQQARAEIDAVTNQYDEQKREEKRAYAKSVMDELAPAYHLHSPFAELVVMKPEYGNISASMKSIREDIESQFKMAQGQQLRHDSVTDLVNVTIQKATDIHAKLTTDDFSYQIADVVNDPQKPATSIIPIVQARIDNIRNAEAAAAKAAQDAEIKRQQEAEAKRKADEAAAAAKKQIELDAVRAQAAAAAEPPMSVTLLFTAPTAIMQQFSPELMTLCQKYGVSYRMIK